MIGEREIILFVIWSLALGSLGQAIIHGMTAMILFRQQVVSDVGRALNWRELSLSINVTMRLAFYALLATVVTWGFETDGIALVTAMLVLVGITAYVALGCGIWFIRTLWREDRRLVLVARTASAEAEAANVRQDARSVTQDQRETDQNTEDHNLEIRRVSQDQREQRQNQRDDAKEPKP